MKRGEIWTLHDARYASKARPVVIVQRDIADFDSVIVCLLTSFNRQGAPSRVSLKPSPTNGLKKTSYVMADKLLTVRQDELGGKIGALTNEQVHAVSCSLARVLAIGQSQAQPDPSD